MRSAGEKLKALLAKHELALADLLADSDRQKWPFKYSLARGPALTSTPVPVNPVFGRAAATRRIGTGTDGRIIDGHARSHNAGLVPFRTRMSSVASSSS